MMSPQYGVSLMKPAATVSQFGGAKQKFITTAPMDNELFKHMNEQQQYSNNDEDSVFGTKTVL